MSQVRKLKKSPVSIGGYILKNIEPIRGREGYGYLAELWKGETRFGFLEDYGDGAGTNFCFYSVEDRELKLSILLKDMTYLQEISHITPNALGRHWVNTGYAAAIGFGELLLELTDTYYTFKNVRSKEKYDDSVAIVSACNHWFRDYKTRDEYVITVKLKDIPLSKREAFTYNACKNLDVLSEDIMMCVYQDSKTGLWHFTLEGYARLLENADAINY